MIALIDQGATPCMISSRDFATLDAIAMQQAQESPVAAYTATGTPIAGDKTTLGIDNEATQVEFTGRMDGRRCAQSCSSR